MWKCVISVFTVLHFEIQIKTDFDLNSNWKFYKLTSSYQIVKSFFFKKFFKFFEIQAKEKEKENQVKRKRFFKLLKLPKNSLKNVMLCEW